MTRMIRYDPIYDVLRPVDAFFEESLFAPVRAWSAPYARPDLAYGAESLGNLPLDVYETDKELIVEASLPGVTEDDIEIEEHEGILTIRAKREEARREEGESWFVHERMARVFERAIPLPVAVKGEKGEATLENGILRILFPKADAAKSITHRIKISAPKLKLPKLGKKEGKIKVRKG